MTFRDQLLGCLYKTGKLKPGLWRVHPRSFLSLSVREGTSEYKGLPRGGVSRLCR